ncbi:MAG: hypothetical protein KUG77_02170 [Nannocystaceae bacterium]|nr:hypothetical protein [Nannocystaceae bacterium]
MVARPQLLAFLLSPLTLAGACGDAESGDASGGTLNDSAIDLTMSGTQTADDDDANDTEGVLDVGAATDGPDATAGGDCPGGGGMTDDDSAYSIIWIANSPEGTVSKIDTRTETELARYFSGPAEGTDDPSRTSVNLSGDVAVTNRAGSVTKIASVPENCVDTNANGVIDTSTGADDVKPWGEDECVLWHLPLGGDGNNTHGPRPTAWDGGAGSAGGNCNAPDENLWVGFWDAAGNNGEFRRIEGSSGDIVDSVSVPLWNSGGTDYGPYGGAVDGGGNLWAIGLWENLIRIDAQTLQVQRWSMPEGAEPYGIAIDAQGRPWTAGWSGLITRFDPATAQFDTVATSNGRRMRGLQVDRDGTVWIAANDPCGAISVDVNSMAIIDENIALPECVGPVGVSIDVDGSVWIPDREGNKAYKLDPATLQSTTITGLVGPYTYSDMTGAGLGLVVNPPAG